MQIAPWTCSNSCIRSLGRKTEEGAVLAGRIPARGLAGGYGEVGEEIEEVASYLMACSVRVGTAGGGSPMWSTGRRPAWLGNERGNDVNAMERGKHEHQ